MKEYIELIENALLEHDNNKLIVIDVQPEYMNQHGFDEQYMFQFAEYINKLNGSVWFLYNGEDSGINDNNESISYFYYDYGLDVHDINCEFHDKGYGGLRSWMQFTNRETIVKVLREMLKYDINDSRDMFSDEDELINFIGESNFDKYMLDDSLCMLDIDIDTLKHFNGCKIIGGARHECLEEFLIIMDALQLNYSVVDELVYG